MWRHWPNILPSLGLLQVFKLAFLQRKAVDTDNIFMYLFISYDSQNIRPTCSIHRKFNIIILGGTWHQICNIYIIGLSHKIFNDSYIHEICFSFHLPYPRA